MTTNTKNKKKSSAARKLIPAIGMLTVSAMMLSSSTYAWFTMNKEVTVTGMEVRTMVGDNLLIASDTLASTAVQDDSNFKSSMDVSLLEALLEPVSTVNGDDFFYTSTFNVGGDGNALDKTSYIAYNASAAATNTSDYNNAFSENYGVNKTVGTAEGYKDYVFQLKANNTDSSAKSVNLTNITLTQGATAETASLQAFRTAVFVEDLGTTPTAPAGGIGTLLTILSNEDSTTGENYFDDGTAVDSVNSLDDVQNLNTAAELGTVAGGTTKYFKVVVRLWLEGEDENCNNSVFNTLTDKWALNLTIKLEDDDTNAVDILTTTTTTAKADLSSATAADDAATNKVIDGVTYYVITGKTLNNDGATKLYATTAGAIDEDSVIYTITGTNHPIDVTNQCTLPTT
jgi:hypothetical protein